MTHKCVVVISGRPFGFVKEVRRRLEVLDELWAVPVSPYVVSECCAYSVAHL